MLLNDAKMPSLKDKILAKAEEAAKSLVSDEPKKVKKPKKIKVGKVKSKK